ncbi:class I SAM-dependent methyltransferase [bacterium]|jgi:SAM-dependent methyltransferase|nr:class I SAM-dependent methyltransferase [bacterium]
MSEADGWGAYPVAAEAHWLGRAEAATDLIGEAAVERLAHAVARLSDLFTTERPEGRFPDYFAEEELLAAYGIFFLPQSFVRTGYALAQAMELRGWKPASATPAILDLGSGPGSCGLAAAHHLRRLGAAHVEVAAVDRSPGALAGLERFAAGFLGASATVRTRVGDAAKAETWPDGDFDLIVAGFVLNEMANLDAKATVAWFTTLRSRLRPGGLIVLLEPALRTTAERLQRLSDAVCAQRLLPRVGPELDQRPCPQLLAGEHWNHEARPWSAPASTAYANRRLFRDLREVRFACALFSDAPLTALPPEAVRLVSDVQIIKGLLRFIVVREGVLQSVEVPTRGLSKHDVKGLAATFGRGDVVAYPSMTGAKVRLTDRADLRVLWSPVRL